MLASGVVLIGIGLMQFRLTALQEPEPLETRIANQAKRFTIRRASSHGIPPGPEDTRASSEAGATHLLFDKHHNEQAELVDSIAGEHGSRPRAKRPALHPQRRQRSQFKGQAKMSTWLTTIVINSARMKLRRRLAPVQLAIDETGGDQDLGLENTVSDARPCPEEAYRKREMAETLLHATSRLSPTLRTTFQLRDVDGLSIREPADLLGVPAGTVKARLARARVRLREAMSKSVL